MLYGFSTLAAKSRAIFCRRWLRRHCGRDFSLSFCPNAYRPRPSLIIYSVTWFMDRFIPWAVLDMWVGRFGSCHGPFWTYRKFMVRFGRGRFGIDPVQVVVLLTYRYVACSSCRSRHCEVLWGLLDVSRSSWLRRVATARMSSQVTHCRLRSCDRRFCLFINTQNNIIIVA